MISNLGLRTELLLFDLYLGGPELSIDWVIEVVMVNYASII